MSRLIYTKQPKRKKKDSPQKKAERESWKETEKRINKMVLRFRPLKPTKRKRAKGVASVGASLTRTSDPLQRVLQFHESLGRGTSKIPSAPGGYTKIVKTVPKYEGEMLERERKAQEETERKKKMVASPYNKGGLQYIAGYDPKDLGKKT